MAGTEYFSETAQPRKHIAVNTMRKSQSRTFANLVPRAFPLKNGWGAAAPTIF